MATGGYRGSGANTTTDFLEEWKAKREKMRAKQAPPAGGLATAAGDGKSSGGAAAVTTAAVITAAPTELNNNNSNGGGERSGGVNCIPLARCGSTKEPPSPSLAGARSGGGAEALGGKAGVVATPPEEEKVAAKGKGSSGPSARKGKGQIEKRKLREKRRSTGVVNIPATEVRRGRGAGRESERRVLMESSRPFGVAAGAAPEQPGGLLGGRPAPSVADAAAGIGGFNSSKMLLLLTYLLLHGAGRESWNRAERSLGLLQSRWFVCCTLRALCTDVQGLQGYLCEQQNGLFLVIRFFVRTKPVNGSP